MWRSETMVLPVHIGIFERTVNGIADRNRKKDIKLLEMKLTVTRGVIHTYLTEAKFIHLLHGVLHVA